MTERVNMREAALEVLLSVNRDGEKSHRIIRSVLEKYQYLPRQERAFFTRLCEGTLEYRLQLDYILEAFSRTPVRKMKPAIREILRMAVYQMRYMDAVPDSAAVNEAVKLVAKKGMQPLKGFVNGVLRNVSRNPGSPEWPPREDEVRYLSVKYSMPEYLTEKWLRELGRGVTEAMLTDFLRGRPLSVRLRGGSADREKTLEELAAQGIAAEAAPYAKNAFYIENYDYLGKIPAFRQGRMVVQDVSSMLAAEAAAPRPGSRVLDICAAPGGKSLYLADLAGEDSLVTARDLTAAKVEQIRENATRCRVDNVLAEQWDACVFDPEMEEKADTVLADVPCSGYGVIARKPDIKYQASREKESSLAELQRRILDRAAAYVKPGGVLVYSTCTVNAAENQENARWFAENYPFVPESLEPYLCPELCGGSAQQGWIQLLPGVHKCDGFFIARFRKREDLQKADGER